MYRRIFTYDGPVFRFGKLIQENYHAQTEARTKEQALNNLTYRYKRAHGYEPKTNITLNGRLTVKEIYEYKKEK